MTPRILAGALAGVSLALALTAPAMGRRSRRRARRSRPAPSFRRARSPPGPLSGTLLGGTPSNGVTPPFPGQPVQASPASWTPATAASGRWPTTATAPRTTSKDFLLRMYRITPDWRTRTGRQRHDPGRPLHRTQRPRRRSCSRSSAATAGSPAATSTSSRCARTSTGTCGSATSSDPGCCTPMRTAGCWRRRSSCPASRPRRTRPWPRSTRRRRCRGSKGFEGMALAGDGETLYPMLEGALVGDPDQRRRMIYEYAPDDGGYSGRPGSSAWRPPPTRSATSPSWTATAS